ncbi:hypothetical protein [Acinetobacter sp.]|uniref:hypothetical protein n=1 Tax=Acinetobacter sp. TaxID=472 RepID=UPI003AFFD038
MGKVPKSKINSWDNLSDQLLKKKKYHVLGFLLDKYIDQFLQNINNKSIYEKIYTYFSKGSMNLSNNEFIEPEIIERLESNKWLDKLKIKIKTEISQRIPNPKQSNSKEVIVRSITRLLKSSEFIDYLTITYPMVPVKLASNSSFLRIDEFTDNFFKILIANKDSPLYRELKDNQHCTPDTGYRIEEENFILKHYFSDSKQAVKVKIWQPIGNYVRKYIKEQEGEINFYNTYCDDFSFSDERWECPIFTGIQFFDLMVKSAIYQKTDEHMWLNYYAYFSDEILKNIDRSVNNKIDSEYPLKFDYLLYELISNCSEWVDAANYLYNDKVKSIVAIESASECLGTMINKLLVSDKFDENKKAYYLEIVLRLMRDLDSKGNERLSTEIFNSIVGIGMFSSRNLAWLKDVYQNVDHVLRLSGSTFDTEIKKAP